MLKFDSHCKNYPDNNINKLPVNTWRGNGHLLFTNWVNYLYQNTPFKLAEIGKNWQLQLFQGPPTLFWKHELQERFFDYFSGTTQFLQPIKVINISWKNFKLLTYFLDQLCLDTETSITIWTRELINVAKVQMFEKKTLPRRSVLKGEEIRCPR